ncbi:MAG: hypothetical protein WC026_13175 [Hyphomicrobium sp.]|uniref:hypothetical protein n=1 Tax=Hyphomicrobium sp. TaxID=82 RepID=UPI003569CF54
MKKIVIENWRLYGDYMLFANLVDKTKKWILLESTSSSITATGGEDALQDFSKLLEENNIKFTSNEN